MECDRSSEEWTEIGSLRKGLCHSASKGRSFWTSLNDYSCRVFEFTVNTARLLSALLGWLRPHNKRDTVDMRGVCSACEPSVTDHSQPL